jgi:hypothetical protein
MNRIQVTSSNLSEVGYDARSTTLEIMFRDGAVYQYFDVPEQVYDGLVNAASAGQYFHANIRGSYRYARA